MALVQLSDVSVDIPIFDASSRSLKKNVFSAATGGQVRSDGGKVAIRALDRLSLRIEHGERVGLIGHNGAGKSTILRVLAGIYEPTSGSVEVEGDVASMFDIGFGMDPDSTGWENIILRGVLLGYSKTEIKSRLAEIGEATELGDFLNMPLRTYSTGMSTRLAFAVSTSIRPDILLIDEGIGAGDAAFMSQAKKRLERFVSEAGILVLASHSDDLIRQMCSTAIWMEHGQIRQHGPVEEVLHAYYGEVLSVRTDKEGLDGPIAAVASA